MRVFCRPGLGRALDACEEVPGTARPSIFQSIAIGREVCDAGADVAQPRSVRSELRGAPEGQICPCRSSRNLVQCMSPELTRSSHLPGRRVASVGATTACPAIYSITSLAMASSAPEPRMTHPYSLYSFADKGNEIGTAHGGQVQAPNNKPCLDFRCFKTCDMIIMTLLFA